MQLESYLAQCGSRWDDRTGATTMPIYQTATFRHPGLGRSTGYDYSRTGNPTRAALEETLATADGGCRGLCFASGMAALDCLTKLFAPGERIVVTEDLYGGTYRLFERVCRPMGVEAMYVDTSDTAAVEAALAAGAKALLVESPTNPLLKVADLRALSRLARAHGALFVVDNTFMTPLLQRPLALGADVAVYSASKYLGGHNDVVAGAMVVRDPAVAERLAFFQNAAGAVPGPQDCWLLLRGLKTLGVRLRRQQASALDVAAYLCGHPAVSRVHYPGLASHPGHDRQTLQATGFGAMVSFELADPSRVEAILSGVRLFLFAESLGGVESLVTLPAVQTHADIEPERRARLGVTDGLLRLSIGLEDPADLIADLEAVL
ncbi:PLP-dependent aspartate aminotransferase family protein [Solidesulfovibrio sp.]|uniref:trans-sulfuration enzyme family protein n=1 Tax=Solidesulfovibrio sp. TaxID=2910990 RepID=UPI002614AAAE|nr:PLP-dependent aspartate aminotransferase family protein [Solidesulfovibrio sp.]